MGLCNRNCCSRTGRGVGGPGGRRRPRSFPRGHEWRQYARLPLARVGTWYSYNGGVDGQRRAHPRGLGGPAWGNWIAEVKARSRDEYGGCRSAMLDRHL